MTDDEKMYLDLLQNHHDMVKHYTYIIDRLNEKIKEMEDEI